MLPTDQDVIEDVESSTTSQTQDDATPAPAVVDPATSSSAEDADSSGDELLNVVRDVVGKRTEDDPASSAEGEDGQQSADDSQEKEPADDYSDVPFHKHPRFRQLLDQKKSFEADAVRYRNVETFLQNAGLTGDEAAEGLAIMGLIKTDPVEAWKKLRPTVQNLLIAAGEVLPAELKARVDKGELTHLAALEISRANANAASVRAKQDFLSQREARNSAQQAANSLVEAASDWETDRKVKDPNFAAKLPLIAREVAYLHSTKGKPNTPQGVRAQLQEAYASVNASFKPPAAPAAAQQKKPAIKPVVGGAVAGDPAPKPSNSLDVVNNVLSRRRNAG